MSLRARLLVGLACLAAVGLSVAAFATYAEQRSFLYTRLDRQVAASELPVAALLGGVRPQGPLRAIPNPFGIRRPTDQPGATFQASGTYGVLLSANGRVLKVKSFTYYGESAPAPPALPSRLPLSQLEPARLHLFTVGSADASLRYRVAAFAASRGRTLVVAMPLTEVDQTLHQLIVVEGLVGGGVVLSLVVLGWLVIGVGLRPLERIGRVASEIAHGNLSRRVTPSGPRTEVGRLGASLNEMLVQIEQAFVDRSESEDRLRRFLSDASHELRTPLAAIRGYAELFRMGAAAEPEAVGRAMSRIEAEATRMGTLVEDLLLLASLDELPDVQRVPVDLEELVQQAAEDVRAIAPDRPLSLETSGPVWTLADHRQLRQVLSNLARNAIIHTPRGTAIALSVASDEGRALVQVRDEGAGLPAGAGDRVFDRFWRAEGGRSRGRGGAGLGLAIVKAVVEANHGEVKAGNAPGGGAVISVWLPLTAAPSVPEALPARGQSLSRERAQT